MSEPKISAFIITAGLREPSLVKAVLKSVSWADEIILVNKQEKQNPFDNWLADDHIKRLYPHARIELLPWTPTVESSRADAVKFCSHDWIIALDDDEILSPACESIFRDFISNEINGEVLQIPIRHYIMGRHDPRAPYWPEWRASLHKRGSINYSSTVHSGVSFAGRYCVLDKNSPAYITHLSHDSISIWIEKTNRYTDQPNRSGQLAPTNIRTFVMEKLAEHFSRNKDYPDDQYLAANATIHAIYEIVDGLKRWESANLPNGKDEFNRIIERILAS